MEKLEERVSLRRREITYFETEETEGLSIEMEWFHAERRMHDVLAQVRPRLSGFRAAGKGSSGLESDGDYLK